MFCFSVAGSLHHFISYIMCFSPPRVEENWYKMNRRRGKMKTACSHSPHPSSHGRFSFFSCANTASVWRLNTSAVLTELKVNKRRDTPSCVLSDHPSYSPGFLSRGHREKGCISQHVDSNASFQTKSWLFSLHFISLQQAADEPQQIHLSLVRVYIPLSTLKPIF